MKKNTYKSGLFAEWLARQLLRLHGFKVLESRYVTGRNTGRAEIDIIARRKNLILFVEVKNRPTPAIGLNAISCGQNMRLRAAADLYLRRIRWIGLARFDVIVIGGLKIRWLKNAV
jgi:putative endonuclease